MVKKGLLVIGALLFLVFTGCSMEPGLSAITLPKDIPGPDSPFKEVTGLTDLIDALGDPDTNKIHIAENITIGGDGEVVIPENKTVEIEPERTLTLNKNVKIEGTINVLDNAGVWVKSDAQITFEPSSKVNIARGGIIETGKNATLTVKGELLVGGDITVGNKTEFIIADIMAGGKASVTGRIFLGEGAKLTVNRDLLVDGDITVGNKAELIIENDVGGGVNGTVIVEKGGHIWDKAPEGGWAWKGTGEGSIVFKYGSYGSVGAANAPNHIVSSVAGTGTQFVLTSTAAQLTLKKDGYYLEGDALIPNDVTIDNTLRIKNGVLTTGSQGKFSIGEGGSLLIEDQGVFDITAGTTGSLTGTIEVKSGGKIIDRTSGASFFKGSALDTTGSIIFHKGALGQLANETTPIGTNSGDTAGKLVQLESGALEIRPGGKYLLDGSAKLVSDFTLNGGLTLAPSSILIVDHDQTLTTPGGLSSIEGGGEGDTASQIVLVSESSYIKEENASPPASKDAQGPKILTVTLQQVSQWEWTEP
jgi:hypothetical protein